ncbi:MAG: zinc-binding dehydrogenase [Ardenticatenaceae bacterium]|nr:zinc-binding dehydrogenase [Ardenticatenaceae bacterium]MCB9445753.1 zinc-binding dehydrogenase [Ardenticatenaceae bacterium]
MKYKSVLVTRRGGLEAVRIVENELHSPLAGEARIRVLATPVCQDDVAIRLGKRPFLKKPPFTPGYTCIGTVEAVGENVTEVAVGDRVAALTQYGCHAEIIYWDAAELVHVPETLDPAEATTLILNYLVAYQILHRVAQVKPGDKALIIGASGGGGTAFLQLGQLAGLKMYGLASASKHAILTGYGAAPIDYHRQDFVEVIRQTEPGGLDYVFNGMGEEYFERSLSILKRGGKLIHYGGPQSFTRFLLLVVKLIFYNLLPNGKTIIGYGTHRLGTDLFKEDWARLFELLAAGQIKPIIAKTLPILDAVTAYEMLESGSVTGNIVLLAPELQQI